MKSYPSIPASILKGEYIYAFDKLDGSNIRAEFSLKRGFFKFGSRNRLLGTDQGVIFNSKDLILQQEDSIRKICKDNRWASAVLFYEFFGDNSKFGIHHPDDNYKVCLIDASPYKKGILNPKDFIKAFADVQTAPMLYHGPCDDSFITSVREGTLEGITHEGVVCKSKGKGNTINMFKIKTNEWYDELHSFCDGDERKFDLLK